MKDAIFILFVAFILFGLSAIRYRTQISGMIGFARMLKDAGGMPAHGNQRAGWDAGCRYDFANPEYR